MDLREKFKDVDDDVFRRIAEVYKDGPPKKTKRSVKYHSVFAEILPKFFEEGQSIGEVAAKFGVNRRSFYRWGKKHPEFKRALNLGRAVAEAWWLRMGREGATCDRKINGYLWNLHMVNRFGWKTATERGKPDPREVKKIEISVLTPDEDKAVRIRQVV